MAGTLYQLGNIMNTRKDKVRSRTYYLECVEISRELEDWNRFAHGLFGLSVLALQEGKHVEARSLAEECVELVRMMNKPEDLASVLSYLGRIIVLLGDEIQAERCYGEALAICREINIPHGIATVLNNLGLLFIAQNAPARARPLLEESLRLCRELNYRHALCFNLAGMGHLEAEEGNLETACAHWQQCLAIRRELQLPRTPILMHLAHLAYLRGHPEQAAQRYGTVQARADTDDMSRWPAMQRQIAAELTAIRAHLGAHRFQQEIDRGAEMDIDLVLDAALKDAPDFVRYHS
jgi:tetratricopeptide (TPR) repeat protein